MNVDRASLSALQLDLLRATLNQGGLTRTRDGYIAQPGSKPFTTRSVHALRDLGLVTLSSDTTRVKITVYGSQVLLVGTTQLPVIAERRAG